jgi:diketogulonate reductase-like aldo/keto reductase
LHTRPIPATGEPLPVVGCGTWNAFDAPVGRRAPLGEVLGALFEGGGSVVDSSPMYGAAEEVVGELLAAQKARPRAFLATKVWTRGREAGIRQMRRSLELLRAESLDLMQIHNLVDWRTHLPTLRAWKAEGRIRYLGVTHYTASAHAELEEVLRAEAFDFVQLNYALDDRAADRRLLPLAAERGVAVLVNRPFGGGELIRRLRGRPLPTWAGEIGCTSWGQILLKWILGHPAVTCVIPGTGKVDHLRDNLLTGEGELPDEAMRARIVAEVAG